MLRVSEESFAKSFYAAPITMAISTIEEGRLIAVNEAFESLTGYTSDEAIGRTALELGFWQDPLERREIVALLEREGEVRDREFTLRDKKGEFRSALFSGVIIDLQGEKRLLSLVRDITARKRAEAALRTQFDQMCTIFDSIDAVLSVSDLESHELLYLNSYGTSLFGAGWEGKKCYEVLQSGQGKPCPFCNNDSLVRDEMAQPSHVRALQNTVTGQWFHCIDRAITWNDGHLARLEVAFDFTERKRAEEALRESEERYRRIVETAREGILVSDATAVTTYVNRRMADILGYLEGEMLGRSLFDFIDSSCRQEVLNQLEQRKKGIKDRYEAVMLRKNGEKIWVTISGSPIFDPKGAFAGSFAMFSDITARKQAEEKIEILNTNLAARASELEAANRELEAFNYTVSHDLRAPLTNITCCSQAIQSLCGDSLDEQCHGFIRTIYEQTLRIDQIITTLLNFSRLAHSEMSRETVDLTSLAHLIIAQKQMCEPQRRVSCAIAEGVEAHGDVKLLTTVLENLIGNAWKYTGKQETAEIEFGVAEFDGSPAYFVRDNGIGFDMAHADSLFRPFERLPGTTGIAGHGIGLATVERIIRRHGGKVWAEGKPGKGATFYFTLQEERPI